jgi:sugar-specific transcriptional regulator TrmB
MSEQADTIFPLTQTYGLSDDESKVYLYLLKHGYSSALVLSRRLSIARTKIYRIIDKLTLKKLVEQKLDDRGMRFGAAHPSVFNDMVANQEAIARTMQKQLPELLQKLQVLSQSHQGDSKVLYYEGIEGLKQVSYNITKAIDTVRVFEVAHLSQFLPVTFAESIREKLVERKITTLDLTNHPKLSGFTNVSEMIKHYSEYRYIDPKKLSIEFEVLIYNDVYATYSYTSETMFAVEIYNRELAAMQKQLFDFVWNQAQPMHNIDDRGSVAIIESET